MDQEIHVQWSEAFDKFQSFRDLLSKVFKQQKLLSVPQTSKIQQTLTTLENDLRQLRNTTANKSKDCPKQAILHEEKEEDNKEEYKLPSVIEEHIRKPVMCILHMTIIFVCMWTSSVLFCVMIHCLSLFNLINHNNSC